MLASHPRSSAAFSQLYHNPQSLCCRRWSGAGPRTPRRSSQRLASTQVERSVDRCRTCSLGSDALGAWSDLASLVASGGSGGKSPFDGLADKLGSRLYCDLDGWHVFLKDIKGIEKLKLNQVLAEAIGTKMPSSGLDGRSFLEELLKITPISLGGGKTQVSLLDMVPAACVDEMGELLDSYDFQR